MERSSWSRLLAFLLACLFACNIVPGTARADEMFSWRGGLGFGKRKMNRGPEATREEFITTLSLTGDMLWGPARPRTFRFGPAMEGRTTDFHTLEGAGGFTLLIPLPLDMSLTTTGLVGLAHRRQAPDGWMGIGTATLGYRSYNYHGWYGYGLNVYFSARRQINDVYLVEYTGGVEVDMLFCLVIPYLAVKNWLNKGDPHED